MRDPLGHCVICRREAADEEVDPGGSRKAVSILAVLAVGVAGVLIYKGATGKTEAPIARAPVESAAPITPPGAAAPLDDLSTPQEEARAVAEARDAADRKAALEKKMREIPIQIYTTKWCELCKTATAYFKGRGYTYTELDVEASPEGLSAMRRKNPKNTVPTIVIGDEVIVGFGPGAVSAAVYRSAEKKVR